MAISFLLKVNTTDVTEHIVQNTYSVNKLPVYKTYEDANGATHRRHIRDKMSGSFQMMFSDITDYTTFKGLIDTNTSATNFSVPVTAYDNMSGNTYTINAFIDYKNTVMQSASLKEYMKVIDVKIEER